MMVSKEELQSTIAQTLEDAAFILSEPLPASERPQLEGEVLEARLSFEGHASGCFVLHAPRAFGEEVAANLMGVDSGDRQAGERALEAMAELLNIVGGNAVHTLFGDEAMIQLGVPEYRVVEALPTPDQLTSPCRASLRAGDKGHTINLALLLDPPASR